MTSWYRRSDEEPFFYLGRYPVHVIGLLILIHVAIFIITALSQTAGNFGWIDAMRLHTPQVLGQGKLWQFFTYPFVHSIDLWFAVEMLMLFWFGRELENQLGRKGFILLYGCLIVCPALILTAIGPFMGPFIFSGSDILHFSIFLSFALLFPSAEMFFGIQAKWVAGVLLALYTLMFLVAHAKAHLIMLWVSAAMALFAVRVPVFSQAVDWLENYKDRQAATRMRQHKEKVEKQVKERERTTDEILDKISKQGMQSLTQQERSTLEKARLELLKKERK